MKMQLKLKEVLREKNITQKQLATMTGLKESVISELANNRRDSLNCGYVGAIVQALDIKDIRDLIVVE